MRISGYALLAWDILRYSFPAVAKSTVGRRNPCITKATLHAPCVFFYVDALAHLFLAQWFLYRCGYLTMVAQAGQLSGWPVSFVAGIPTPVWATTHERRNSGGSCNQLTKEIAAMALQLAYSHPQFTYLFAAVLRTDRYSHIHMLRTVAPHERAARRIFSRDYILLFAGRLPFTEVCA